MSMKQCMGGHWFDDAKYTTCPYCNTDAQNVKGSVTDSGDEGKTIAFYSAPSSEHKESKQSIVETVKDKEEYVTGWLVCTEGPDKGTDYRIFHGQNFVGRDYSMDIVIRNDNKVSRIKHCCIVYDKKSNRTFLVPENGSLVEYDGVILSSAIELRNYDVFKLGDSTMTYVAFCEGGRKWAEE